METPLDESGERRMGGKVAETVGAQRHDQRRVRSVCPQRVEERRALSGQPTEREDLLALVHDDDGVCSNRSEPGDRFRRVRPWCDDPDGAALPLKCRGDPCAHQR